MESEKYIPGVCNIGPEERKMRKGAGWFGIVLFLGLATFLYLTQAPHGARFFLLIPALLATTGWVQYQQRFCVNFGMRGLQNMDKAAWQTEKVMEDGFRRKDRQKSLRLIALSVVLSLAATLAVYFL